MNLKHAVMFALGVAVVMAIVYRVQVARSLVLGA